MKILTIRKNICDTFILPEIIDGNYWTKLSNTNGIIDFINIVANNNKWIMYSNDEVFIINNNEAVTSITLDNYAFYTLKYHDEFVIMATIPTYEESFEFYKPLKNTLLIGSDASCDISYQNNFLAPVSCKITSNNGVWTIELVESKIGLISSNNIFTKKDLVLGDTIFIGGIYFIFMDSFFVFSNPNHLVKFNPSSLELFKKGAFTYEKKGVPDLASIELYKEEEYYQYTPRLRSKIEPKVFTIDDPPQSQKTEELPVLLTIIPTLLMSITSVYTGALAIIRVSSGDATILNSMPSILMCITMLGSSLIFPMFMKSYNKKRILKAEKIRLDKYGEYLNSKKTEIEEIFQKQATVLKDNLISLDECINIIRNRKRTIWERELKHDDFLVVRIGIGEVPLQVDFQYGKEKFSLQNDELKERVNNLVENYRVIKNVPIPFSMIDNNIHAILGNKIYRDSFIKGLLLQLITFHGFVNLKLVFLIKNSDSELFQFMKTLPHCWSDDKQIRFFATNNDEVRIVSSYLDSIWSSREEAIKEDKDNTFRSFIPYYHIITDDYKIIKNLNITNNILNSNNNLGFGLTILANGLEELPNECKAYLYIDKVNSGYFENEIVAEKQKVFTADFMPNVDIMEIAKILANIPMKAMEAERLLPKVITFLEMYQTGRVEQLNILNRWKESNPINSLKTPIGVYPNGELFELDLHEKAHGPHGLIAGSTGSGKSEFIITFILSMAVNYSPLEVQFVLIDYKGGGLAGAFENKETGMKLPHLAGTITNLDKSEMNRSLASIESELRRRQQKFNEARDSLNESTIDIYKYQSLYRQGLVKESIAHLFIICDEFAELKSQQPEFMDELISISRIGRSLGVHLILATQKPSGIVNDQIWSNSKFKVCLKVQDRSDSMEVIKRPDAAEIKETGRFYLQVGYNEYFALGQSAWCGAKYQPTDKIRKKMDDSINIIDNVGNVIDSLNDIEVDNNQVDYGEQITSIIKMIINTASKINVKSDQLWLDPIPSFITTTYLAKKYNVTTTAYKINPIIGELDDPKNQRQTILRLDLSNDANTIIYGMTGSGKENMLQTIIYDTSIHHGPNEVNFYVLDFGAETLKAFQKFPQVGDVITLDDREKIKNLFDMLVKEEVKRKNLFVDYNGSYQSYLASGHYLPAIIVIINNYEAFQENYDNEEYPELLIKLSRSASKYGISFILTATASNSIRFKLAQNFPKNIVLRLNNESDYSSILGRTNGLVPRDVFGRGLIKIDDLYEFQSASISKEENLNTILTSTVEQLSNIFSNNARNVPILPDKVTYDLVKNNLDKYAIPVGMYTDNLEVANYNWKDKNGHLFLTNYISNIDNFYPELLKVLANYGILAIIDAEKVIDSSMIGNSSLEQNNYKDMIIKINSDINYRMEQQNSNYNQVLICIIIGIKKIVDSLDKEGKDILNMMFTNATKYPDNYKFIFLDTIDSIKGVEYESWYKQIIDNNNGIFIGSGIDNQFVLKLSSTTKEMRSEISPNYGYIVYRGKSSKVKLLEFDDIKNSIESL